MYKKGLLSKYKVPLAHWSIFNNLSFDSIMTMSCSWHLVFNPKAFLFYIVAWVFACFFVLFEEVRISMKHVQRGSYWMTY